MSFTRPSKIAAKEPPKPPPPAVKEDPAPVEAAEESPAPVVEAPAPPAPVAAPMPAPAVAMRPVVATQPRPLAGAARLELGVKRIVVDVAPSVHRQVKMRAVDYSGGIKEYILRLLEADGLDLSDQPDFVPRPKA